MCKLLQSRQMNRFEFRCVVDCADGVFVGREATPLFARLKSLKRAYMPSKP
jgi:hypothetical protein